MGTLSAGGQTGPRSPSTRYYHRNREVVSSHDTGLPVLHHTLLAAPYEHRCGDDVLRDMDVTLWWTPLVLKERLGKDHV